MEPFIELESGNVLKVFNNKETFAIHKKWINTFAKDRDGVSLGQYKWHIFCADRYKNIEGSRANDEYESHIAERYIVISDGKDNAFMVDEKPMNLIYQDVYVFPENFAWTMAFTHEEGWLGPYFAKHKNYAKLNEENIKHLKAKQEKLKQIEIAKQNGWM